MDRMPRRLDESRATAMKLREEVYLYTILTTTTTTSSELPDPDSDERVLKNSISINVWTDGAGRDHVEIESARDIAVLEVKGILHDALYAIAHIGDRTSVH